MNWPNVVPLTFGAVICLIALLRVERKWLWAVIVLVGGVGYLVWRWAQFTGQWVEVWTSAGLALGIVGVWWLVRGRKLPPPVSTIKVWGQESAPKPKPAELQAELNRLRDEKAKLEAELQKLKGKQNGHGDTP
jgi:hypothetical protein